MSKKTTRQRVSPNFDVQILDPLNTSPWTKDLATIAKTERKLHLMQYVNPNSGICDPLTDPTCGGGGGGGSTYVPPPAPPPRTPFLATAPQQAPATCQGSASMSVGANSTSGNIFTQNFTIGQYVWQGYTYQVGVYSYTVQITAQAGDTPNSIAQRLADAVNNTALATWKQYGSDTSNYKPTAVANGATITTTCDASHSFYGDAYGNCPVAAPAPAPAQSAPATVAPTASVAPINDITLPTSAVALDGSGSQANNSGSSLTYLWSQVGSKPATVDNATAASTTLRGLVQGSYTIRLTVTDSVTGQSSYKDVSFSVNAEPTIGLPTVVLSPVNDIQLPNNSVALDGTGSHASDGSPVTFLWTKSAGGNAVADNAKNAQTILSGLEAGVYTIRLTITDRQGNSAYKELSFSVNPATAVTLSNPAGSSGLTGFSGGYSSGGDSSGGDSSTAPATLPIAAQAPQRNWLWLVIGAMAVGYAVFTKEGGKAAPIESV